MNIPGFLLDILEKLNLVHDRKYAPKSYVQKKKDMASCSEQSNMESISKNYLDTLVGTVCNSSFFWICYFYARVL